MRMNLGTTELHKHLPGSGPTMARQSISLARDCGLLYICHKKGNNLCLRRTKENTRNKKTIIANTHLNIMPGIASKVTRE